MSSVLEVPSPVRDFALLPWRDLAESEVVLEWEVVTPHFLGSDPEPVETGYQ